MGSMGGIRIGTRDWFTISVYTFQFVYTVRMKFPDLTKSHTDSPDFKRDLKSLERETDNLFTHTQTILNILAEKASLVRRDIQLTKILVTEIQCMGITHVVKFDDEGEEKLDEVRRVEMWQKVSLNGSLPV